MRLENNKTKRLTVMLAVLCLLVSLMAGCSLSSSETKESQASGQTQQTSKAPQTKETKENSGTKETQAPETQAEETNAQTDAPVGDSEVSAVFHLDLLSDKGVQDYDSTRVKEIIVDPDGSSFVFWTTKTLTGLRLMEVEYNGDQFLEGKVYCSYDEFTEDDIILLTHSFPESMPDVKITFYDDKGALQTYYITQSGLDSRPVLITEEALLFSE